MENILRVIIMVILFLVVAFIFISLVAPALLKSTSGILDLIALT